MTTKLANFGGIPIIVSNRVPNNVIYTVSTPAMTLAGGGNFGTGETAWTYQYQYQNTQQTLTAGFYDALMGNLYYQQPWPWDRLGETAKQKAEREKRAAERMAAEKRAEHLLFTILTPSQVKQYTDDAYFEVPVGERLYRLHKRSRSMNVELIEAGKPKIKFCAHPHDAHDLPIPDVLLGQLLALRTNEAEFLRVANRTVVQ